MLGRGQFKGLTEEVIYRTSNIVLWIWNITFNKFLFVHIFHLCLWINWSGVIGAVATIMTWWRTTSQLLLQRIKHKAYWLNYAINISFAEVYSNCTLQSVSSNLHNHLKLLFIHSKQKWTHYANNNTRVLGVHEEFCLVGRVRYDSQTSISISLFDTQIWPWSVFGWVKRKMV